MTTATDKRTERERAMPNGSSVLMGSLGQVLYDGECAMCSSLARRYSPELVDRGFRPRTLQDAARDPKLATRLGLSGDSFDHMWVVGPRGQAVAGVDAILLLAGSRIWARPLVFLARYQLGLAALRAAYTWVARHRFTLSRLWVGRAGRRES